MKVEVDQVEEVIDKKVDSYTTSTRIIIPKKYAGRKYLLVVKFKIGRILYLPFLIIFR